MIGVLLNLALRLSILAFTVEVVLLPDDPRFAGKAIPARNAIVVILAGLFFPVLYFWGKLRKSYPVWYDDLFLSIFWLDMAGNSFDLYDTYFWFDLVPHFHGPGAVAGLGFGVFGLSRLSAIGLANVIHTLLEIQEYYTDVLLGTQNVRGTFDVMNDLAVGLVGAALYGAAARARRRPRSASPSGRCHPMRSRRRWTMTSSTSWSSWGCSE